MSMAYNNHNIMVLYDSEPFSYFGKKKANNCRQIEEIMFYNQPIANDF